MKHVHFLGIAGSGASAIAAIAKDQGFVVTGCDKHPKNEFTKNLTGIPIKEGHSRDHLGKIDILAVTPAIYSADPDNEELRAAKDQGIRIMTWQQFMGEFLEKDKFIIAVAGTHGKSTTTAMIGLILEAAGLDPTVELGAIVPKWGKNYRLGKSKYFVTEADEAYDNFLVSHPDVTVVTNIEMDHPDYFHDFSQYQDSFHKFLGQTKQTIIANLQDPVLAEILKHVMKEKPVSSLDYAKQQFNLELQIPGQFNILNANAAFQVGLLLGLEPAVIKKSLESFTGVGRRFELMGSLKGAQIYSDFAHHPTEVRVNLAAMREKFPDKKIIAFFQPHMFSRTQALWDDFVQVFQQAPVTQVYLLDIYYARENPIDGVNSQKLAQDIGKSSVHYLPRILSSVNLVQSAEFLSLKQMLERKVGEDTILFFLGAGPIHEVAKNLVEK